MSEVTTFTVQLEPELQDAFLAEVNATNQPASQILRELIHDFIMQRRQNREYDEFLREKVEKARASIRSGEGRSNEDVERDFAERRRSNLTMRYLQKTFTR